MNENFQYERVNVFISRIEYNANKNCETLSHPKPWCNDSGVLNLHPDYYTTIMIWLLYNHVYYSFKIFPRFWLVKTTRIIHHNQLLFSKNYWTIDVKMTSKVQPAADYWTVDRENLGQGCVIFGERKNKELNGETPLRRRKYRAASVDNTLLDLQNSSYPTQPHSIIAKYLDPFWLLPPMNIAWPWNVLDNKIETSLYLFPGVWVFITPKRRSWKLRPLEIKKEKNV